jgi:DNA-binding MarR family transcriptional regulator
VPEDKSPEEEPLSLLDPRVVDPDEELVQRAHLPAEEITQVVRVLESMRRWRETEAELSEASRRYMKLGNTDMRALRYLIAAQRNGAVVTPSSIAAHLGISTASTTKLLDRLAAGGHVRRLPHPTDRRSLAIEVSEDTSVAARATVGRIHARRFDVAASLAPEERDVVIRFLDELVATAEDLKHPDEADVAEA